MSAQLEKKIASALLSSTITSADLATLITDTEAAIVEADATARAEKHKALDLALAPDPKIAREALAAAEFGRDRLTAVLPRLKAILQDVTAQEYLTTWKQGFAILQTKRDLLALELAPYPDLVAKLVDLLSRVAANDAEISKLHLARPAGVALHLLGAELTARNLESGFSAATPSITRDLQLPDWGQGTKLLYPIPQPASAAVMAPPVHRGSDWWKDADHVGAELRADQSRVAEFYENQQRLRDAAS